MHTAPESCTRRNCKYVTVRLLVRHMSHAMSVWGNPLALKNFSMWGRQCRELMDKTLAWAQVKGNWKCRRTGWGPKDLKAMKGVCEKWAPVGGSKGPVPFAPLWPTWCRLWYFAALRILIMAVLSLGRVRGRGRGGVKGGGGGRFRLFKL